MMNFLENLRDKPVSYRRKVVFFATVGITALILLTWLLTLRYELDVPVEDSQVAAEPFKPIGDLSSEIGDFFGSVKDLAGKAFGGAEATATEQVAEPDTSKSDGSTLELLPH